MANKKQLKWYHYTAKVILICFALPIAPILIVISLSMGGGPLDIYKDMWYDNR